MKNSTFKKGQPLQVQLKNDIKIDLIFVDYSRITGLAFGKFKDSYGEFDVKTFNLITVVNKY